MSTCQCKIDPVGRSNETQEIQFCLQNLKLAKRELAKSSLIKERHRLTQKNHLALNVSVFMAVIS